MVNSLRRRSGRPFRSRRFGKYTHVLSLPFLPSYKFISAIAPYKGGPKLHVSAPSATLPDHYDFLLTDIGVAMRPTHAFAIYPTFSAALDARVSPKQLPSPFPKMREVEMLPTHGAMWAAHCAKLPPMGHKPIRLESKASPTAERPGLALVRLPLVPIPLPFPPGFLFLARFAYSGVQWHFVAEMLLPIDDRYDAKAQIGSWDEFFEYITIIPRTEKTEHVRKLTPEGADKLGALLARRYEFIDICRLARCVWGTHQNAVYLGMVDAKLWESFEFAWKAVLKALEIADAAAMDVASDDEE